MKAGQLAMFIADGNARLRQQASGAVAQCAFATGDAALARRIRRRQAGAVAMRTFMDQYGGCHRGNLLRYRVIGQSCNRKKIDQPQRFDLAVAACRFLSQIMCRPSSVSRSSTCLMYLEPPAMSVANPPVATIFVSLPSSPSKRSIMPSTNPR